MSNYPAGATHDPRAPWLHDDDSSCCDWCNLPDETVREFCRIDAQDVHPVIDRVQQACETCIDRYGLDEL